MVQHHVPSHLSEGARRWLAAVRTERDWSATQWRLAQLAAEAWDRSQNARRILGREGQVCRVPVTDKHGDPVLYDGIPTVRLTAHPAVGITRDATATFSKLVTQLGLDRTAPPEVADPADTPGQTDILSQLAARMEA